MSEQVKVMIPLPGTPRELLVLSDFLAKVQNDGIAVVCDDKHMWMMVPKDLLLK